MRDLNVGFAFATALVEELYRSGVRHAVVSPGSRSAPLALGFASLHGVRDHSVLDERSAGFYALGLARATHEPVALVCTSGSATAHYLPAVIEANLSRVPLVVLTADRPPELRDCGAGQTIEQTHLYGRNVRFFAETPLPEADDAALRTTRALACRAVDLARGPVPGPVHLNVPLREPLAPLPVPEQAEALSRLSSLARNGREAERAFVDVVAAEPPSPSDSALDALAQSLANVEQGWLVVGPLDARPRFAEVATRLADRLGWPIFAEPLSQLRCGPHGRGRLVDAHDVVLKADGFADANAPRTVLRFGAMPTSKAFRLFLERHPEIEQLVVDPDAWNEPTALATRVLRADPVGFATEMAARLDPPAAGVYARRWIEAGRRARAAFDAALDRETELNEPNVVRTLAERVPASAQVFCASSMPVRDVDVFWRSCDTPLRFVANRGANGIDGLVSCALGHAVGSARPTVLLCGDLALLHDVGALALARATNAALTILVVDNAGGGIFELLPVARAARREVFERHFGTPPAVDVADVVRGFGVRCEEVADAKDLSEALHRTLARNGVDVIVARVSRSASRDLRERLQAAVHKSLAEVD